jgi:hypothetical protein
LRGARERKRERERDRERDERQRQRERKGGGMFSKGSTSHKNFTAFSKMSN